MIATITPQRSTVKLTVNNTIAGVNMSHNLGAIIEKFISEQDVLINSKNVYRRTLKQFFNYIDNTGLDLNTIDRTNIIEYKESLIKEGKSSLTISSYLTAVRKFYEWTEANLIYPNIAKGIKAPARLQQFRKQPLQPAQAKELLEVYSDNKRDNAIINLLLRTGLRTIEVVRANVSDITYRGGERILLIQGKGRIEKDSYVVLTDKTFAPIEAYLIERGAKNNEPLFTSNSNQNKGQRLTTKTISTIAKTALKEIGLNDRSYTAHSLRHTTATNILRAGGSVEIARQTLRHASVTTTEIYTATMIEEQRLKNSGERLLDSIF